MKVGLKRMIRVVLDVPLPEWIDTDAAKPPSALGLVMGATRKRPTAMCEVLCMFPICPGEISIVITNGLKMGLK